MISQELTSVDAQDVKAVAALPHLNGAINEAMRLLPAVLTFVTRVTPPEGLEVEGKFIPGNVKIAAPRYSIGRRKFCSFLLLPSCLSRSDVMVTHRAATDSRSCVVESAWEEPHRFHPARWYSRPDMIRDRRAFAPFGLGTLSFFGWTLCV